MNVSAVILSRRVTQVTQSHSIQKQIQRQMQNQRNRNVDGSTNLRELPVDSAIQPSGTCKCGKRCPGRFVCVRCDAAAMAAQERDASIALAEQLRSIGIPRFSTAELSVFRAGSPKRRKPSLARLGGQRPGEVPGQASRTRTRLLHHEVLSFVTKDGAPLVEIDGGQLSDIFTICVTADDFGLLARDMSRRQPKACWPSPACHGASRAAPCHGYPSPPTLSGAS